MPGENKSSEVREDISKSEGKEVTANYYNVILLQVVHDKIIGTVLFHIRRYLYLEHIK